MEVLPKLLWTISGNELIEKTFRFYSLQNDGEPEGSKTIKKWLSSRKEQKPYEFLMDVAHYVAHP